MFTIEDLIEISASMSSKSKIQFTLLKSDINLMLSLGKQVLQGTALTDRQHELAKTKLIEYKDQFENNEIHNIEQYFDKLRMPLRSIDRSRWVKFIDNKIAVRFSFNKKLINAIENIRLAINETKEFDNNVHYFSICEKNVYVIISNVIDKNFKIDDDVLEYYNFCKKFFDKPSEYVPYIKDFKLLNFPAKLENDLKEKIGPCNNNNIKIYKDRAYRYNYIIDYNFNNLSPIEMLILNRTSNLLNFPKSVYNTSDVIKTIVNLRRDPFLVIINTDHEYEQLVTIYDEFSKYYTNSEQSVLFRLDNTNEGISFNNFIHDNNLNNSVDKATKVVYIKENKLPKPLLTSAWKPITLFCLRSYRLGANVENYFNTHCDMYISADDSSHSEYLVRNRKFISGYM